MRGQTVDQRLSAIQAAHASLTDVYSAVQNCVVKYREAGLPLPEDINRLLSASEGESKAYQNRTLKIPPDPYAPTPEGWVSVPVASAMPVTLAYSVLANKGEMPIKKVIFEVSAFNQFLTYSAMFAVLRKLKDAKVVTLENGVAAPAADSPRPASIAQDGRVWGPPEAFQPQELAAHRREAIVEILKANGASTRAEIVEALKRTPWVRARLDPSLIKVDLDVLAKQGSVEREESTPVLRWKLVSQPEQAQLRLAK